MIQEQDYMGDEVLKYVTIKYRLLIFCIFRQDIFGFYLMMELMDLFNWKSIMSPFKRILLIRCLWKKLNIIIHGELFLNIQEHIKIYLIAHFFKYIKYKM